MAFTTPKSFYIVTLRRSPHYFLPKHLLRHFLFLLFLSLLLRFDAILQLFDGLVVWRHLDGFFDILIGSIPILLFVVDRGPTVEGLGTVFVNGDRFVTHSQGLVRILKFQV